MCFMKEEKQGFRIKAGCSAAVISMIAFALCVPFQIMGYADSLKDPTVAVSLVFLPVLAALLMIVVLLKSDQSSLRFSIFPVFIGVLGFAFKLVIDPRGTGLMHHIAAIILYILIVLLWALTVLYVIKTKWVLTVLFLIPFFKHIVLNDMPVLLGITNPVPLSTWLKEFSMLSFMLALSFCALSFEKVNQ